MTREESVSGCLAQWEFMAKTGTAKKQSYVPARDINNNCFFCEYNLRLDCPPCDRCPGLDYWAEGDDMGLCLNALADGDIRTSLYYSWRFEATSKKSRKLWAHRIVWMIWLIQEDSKND